MSALYDLTRWYWFVGADQSKAYSSEIGDYVPVTDSRYQSWAAQNNFPAAIDTETSLGQVLAKGYPDVPRPLPTTILDGYQQNQSDEVFQHKLVKLLFTMLNRIQVLEGKQALTVAQAKAYVKGLM
ncbi:hypothetical protein [Bradyrhizobium genomosp. III]|uniref:hypothetical protein n=1 Tax=Bradyrhizobium genomosp. III TaxID=2683271 RepID=UPI0004BAF616|nr:hypothetical protein [Bradyrhizobium sp. CCBAU 15544]